MDNWILLALLSGLLFGAYNVLAKVYSEKAPQYVVVLAISGFIFLFGLAYLLLQKNPVADVQATMPVMLLIALSALAWFAGTFLQMVIYGDPKTQLSIAATMITVALGVSAAVLGVIFLGDKLTLVQAAGIVLAIVGTAMVTL